MGVNEDIVATAKSPHRVKLEKETDKNTDLIEVLYPLE